MIKPKRLLGQFKIHPRYLHITRVILVCIMLMACGAGLFSQAFPKEIIVGYHEDFFPYSYEKDGKLVGIFPDMVRKTCERMGVKPIFRKYPWRRMLVEAQNRKVDAIMPLFKTNERKEFLEYPSRGFALAESYFFTSPDANIQYHGSLEDLKGETIGIVEDYYGEEFANADFLEKEICASDEVLFDKFIKGRFKVGFASDLVIRYYENKSGILNRIKFLDPPFFQKVLYIAFVKNRVSSQFIQQFSQTSKEMAGSHQEILENYHCMDHWVFLKPLVIGFDQEDNHPYTYWQGTAPRGICTGIIAKAAGLIDLEVTYKKIIWSDFPVMIKNGQIDAIIPVFKTKKRESYMLFPETGLAAEKNVLFTRKDTNVRYLGDLKDLKKNSIGIVSGYSYGEAFDQAKGLNKITYDNLDKLIQGVLQGHANIGIGSDRVIEFFAKKKGIAHLIQYLSPPFPREYLYIAFSKSRDKAYSKLAQSFTQAVKRLRITGEYQEIFINNGLPRPVVRLVSYERPPYHGAIMEHYGPIAEIVTTAFEQTGYQVHIEFVPWSLLLEKLKKGTADAGFSGIFFDKIKQDFLFSQPICFSSPLVLLKRYDNNIVFRNLDDLKRYRIGVLKDFEYHPDIDHIPGLQKIEANSNEANIQNLLLRRLDLVILDQRQSEYLLEKISPSESAIIEIMPLTYQQKKPRQELRLLISKESVDAEQLIIDFNHALKKMQTNGTLERIFKSHGINNETK